MILELYHHSQLLLLLLYYSSTTTTTYFIIHRAPIHTKQPQHLTDNCIHQFLTSFTTIHPTWYHITYATFLPSNTLTNSPSYRVIVVCCIYVAFRLFMFSFSCPFVLVLVRVNASQIHHTPTQATQARPPPPTAHRRNESMCATQYGSKTATHASHIHIIPRPRLNTCCACT